MHDRAAFKGTRALVARIPAHTAPALHSLALYGCPATTASLSGPSWARQRALLSCSGPPARRAPPIRSILFPPRPPATAGGLTASGPWVPGGVSVTKTRQRPRNSFFGVLFLWMVRPYPFISVHICAYLSISVHICLYICLYLSISDHELATVGRAILIL